MGEVEDDKVTIKLPLGSIMGRKQCDRKGYIFYSFQTVPYAKPPLKHLRFKAPEPVEEWEGVLDATEDSPKCYQKHVINIEEVGDCEDCLYLNVYTPFITKKGPLCPVMVFIHGGAFLQGSSRMGNYGPEYLMTGTVVLVTVNYRVGILGFLSMEDASLGVPGNAGLKDQVMALQWVQDYIKYFRGDPKNVTIFGCSSGAASVHLHILSPMSKGLFHKAIMQSGCALNPWVNGYKGTGRLVAEVLEYFNTDEEEILAYLRAISVDKLQFAQDKIVFPPRIDINWSCSPVIETQKTEPAFLTDDPIDVIRSGNYNKVPMLIGYTLLEGLFFDAFNIRFWGHRLLIDDFGQIIPNNIICKKGGPLEKTIAKKVKAFYFGTRDEPNERNMMPHFHLITDTYFLRGIHKTVINHVETSNVDIYYYRFSLETELNTCKKSMAERVSYKKYIGPSHGDELNYLFRRKVPKVIEEGSIEDQAIDLMVWFWTNFARNGSPAHGSQLKWDYVLRGRVVCMDIGSNLETIIYPESERMNFWNGIYQNDERTKYL